jgi:hypothetical protein
VSHVDPGPAADGDLAVPSLGPTDQPSEDAAHGAIGPDPRASETSEPGSVHIDGQGNARTDGPGQGSAQADGQGAAQADGRGAARADGQGAVAAALREFDGLSDVPLFEHPDVYQRIHTTLQSALADIDEA